MTRKLYILIFLIIGLQVFVRAVGDKYKKQFKLGCVNKMNFQNNKTNFDFFYFDEFYQYNSKLHEYFSKTGAAHKISFLFLGYEDALKENEPGGMFVSSKQWRIATDGIVCLVDYSSNFNIFQKIISYMPSTVDRVDFVSKWTARFICDLKKNGAIITMRSVVLVGYCMGAHIGGQTGKAISQCSGQLVSMVLGLDPTGWGFRGSRASRHINKSDGEYVQVVHTSSLFGTSDYENAHCHIIVEGGNRQPGCEWSINPVCSHARALYIHHCVVQKFYEFRASKTKSKNVQYRQLANDTDETDVASLRADECILGVFNKDRRQGIFYLTTGVEIFNKKKSLN